MAMRATARRALACETEAAELETQLEALVQDGRSLLDESASGPSSPPKCSCHGPIGAGSAPKPPSLSSPASPRSRRHRGPWPVTTQPRGDRQLNRALHTVVLVRMRQHPETKTYVQRRLAEGEASAIKRCLKRYVARQLFRQLEARPQRA